MFKPWPLALAITLAAVPTAFAWAEGSAQQQLLRFDLPAASLAHTLNAIARQGGQVMSLDPALVVGKQASAIQGEMSALQAVQEALAGSGLQLIVTGSGTFSVVPAVDAKGALELGATNINSVGLGETTEGSGSYTTGAVTIGKTPQSLRRTPSR